MTTINNMELSATKEITATKDEEGYCPRGINLKATFNRENAYIKLSISSRI